MAPCRWSTRKTASTWKILWMSTSHDDISAMLFRMQLLQLHMLRCAAVTEREREREREREKLKRVNTGKPRPFRGPCCTSVDCIKERNTRSGMQSSSHICIDTCACARASARVLECLRARACVYVCARARVRVCLYTYHHRVCGQEPQLQAKHLHAESERLPTLPARLTPLQNSD